LRRDTRIVDVGCGGGELLLHAAVDRLSRLLGLTRSSATTSTWEADCACCETQLAAVQEPQDVVMFHHSLEHIGEQRPVLAAAYALLVPGGRCVVRIPASARSRGASTGTDWCALDAPAPSCTFIPTESIRMLAEQAGFRVEEHHLRLDLVPVLGSEQYRRGMALMDAGLACDRAGGGAFSASELRDFGRRARSSTVSTTATRSSFICVAMHEPPTPLAGAADADMKVLLLSPRQRRAHQRWVEGLHERGVQVCWATRTTRPLAAAAGVRLVR